MSSSTIPSILAVGRLLPTLHQKLLSLGALHDLPLPLTSTSWTPALEAAAPSVRAAVTTSFGGFPSELFDRLPGLQIIANFGVGVDSIGERLNMKSYSYNLSALHANTCI